MPQPDKRSLLQVLTKARLRELVDGFELKLAAAEAKDAHVELLARSKKATLPKILELLLRDELKDICRAHGLEDGGREKSVLIARLLGQPGAVEPEPTTEAPAPAVPPRTVPARLPWRDTGPLEPGQIVHVRARQYLVDEVVPPPQPGHATLVRLSCLEDDAQGDALEVLWEHELDAHVLGRASWDRVASRGFDRPELFSAYLHTLRWSCVTATDPRLFQAPYRAGIEVKDYQLEPLRKALAMPRVRLFIADDVGLGKTIEAGLILREMLLRQRVRRIVVACPPSVVRQWQDEMEQRFGLTFVVLDRDYVAACRRERGYGINPWTTHTRFIVSHPLLRDETYAAPLREWLRPDPGDEQAVTAQSLLILDEAHNAAPASGARYAVDSHFTRAIRELAQRFEHRLFLSATPHNGHSNSFSALLEILDPDRFCRGVPPDARLLDEVMVRRLKSDLREISTDDFPDRRIVPEILDGLPDDAPELLLSRLLQRYRELREARLAAAPRGQRHAGMLVIVALQKRLLSSIEAFACTLAVHRRAIDRKVDAEDELAGSAELPSSLSDGTGADDDRAELPEDEVAREEAAQLDLITARAPAVGPEERALLAEMTAVAETARHLPDARVRRLVVWLKEQMCPDLGRPGAAWNDRRVILFTEYADTKRYLMHQLAAAIDGSEQADARLRAFHGGMGDGAREQIKAAFNADPGKHPLRILVATDAAREGVNLQNHCAHLFHFDIPWNPSRMEQRNGRIDRKLQRAPVVYCHYFVLPQRAEDRVLDVLVRKTATIHRELGSLSPVVERNLDELLRGGIAHTREADLSAEIAAQEPRRKTLLDLQIDRELEQVRRRQHDLKQRVQELRELLAESQQWLGLSDDHFRGALSAALELLGAEPLAPLDDSAQSDPARARWRLPALDRRAGADPSWAATLDALRAPRRREQKLWDWRREAPIRPIVFRDPRSLDGEVVHLHLEHRVVQRLLGRFRSQGFLHDELTRACVLRTDDPEPKLLVLGRLSLYGPRAARLHDEVLAVAAEWIDPDLRGRKRLTALPRGDRDEVLAQLERALGTPRLRDVSPALQTRLRAHAARDVAELLPQLDTRARERISSAEKQLHRRGQHEADALAQVIAGQIARIQRKIAEHDDSQLGLEFRDEHERRQLAADRRYWDVRLPELAREAARAPEAIRRGYGVQAVRVEPVGLVYLWPVSA
ncbi:DISARM system SNF2-like helicase DrmD [Nannocystis radixulma]|uniref:DISARM system SNF2-like helicase DrmD n=1 Tax=Nannocystis radixulma TaxID=2995305 RepID=A0ABT5BJW2_9BACT|nr:DISARM system SNF2-like helicase DrmD [Nannocystis radixulma]MDC0674428.1 DISARM system SNF2-like helicase DrmD [Nannocystis radixulma]